MIRRPTWILAAVFAGLLAFTWYFQSSKEDTSLEATPTAGKEPLLVVEENAIAMLEIEGVNGNSLLIGRDEEGLWNVEQPEGFETDLAKAEAAITQLTSLLVDNSIGPVQDLSIFGLQDAAYTITLTLNGGEKQVIRVGDVVPTGNGYYVALNGDSPKVVSKYSLDAFLEIVEKPPLIATATVAPQESITPPTEEEVIEGTPTVEP